MQTLPVLSADATAFLLPDQPDAHYAQCRTAVCNEVRAKNTTTLDLVRVICHSCCTVHFSPSYFGGRMLNSHGYIR